MPAVPRNQTTGITNPPAQLAEYPLIDLATSMSMATSLREDFEFSQNGPRPSGSSVPRIFSQPPSQLHASFSEEASVHESEMQGHTDFADAEHNAFAQVMTCKVRPCSRLVRSIVTMKKDDLLRACVCSANTVHTGQSALCNAFKCAEV